MKDISMKVAQGCSELNLRLIKLLSESVNPKLSDFPRTLPSYTKRTIGDSLSETNKDTP
jgi:hypothetical protein